MHRASMSVVGSTPSMTSAEQIGVAGKVERPAFIMGDTVAYAFPAVTMAVEVAVFELYSGAIWRLGGKSDLHFAGSSRVGFDLPIGADVPGEHHPVRRFV